MKIGVVIVAFGLPQDTEKLLAAVHWLPGVHVYLYLHSQIPEVVRVCQEAAIYKNVHYFPYGENRGLAKSWNEGMIAGYGDGMDVMLIANDDALPQEGDLIQIAYAAYSNRNYYMVDGWGFDEAQKREGDMRFALAAINPIALDTIGYFDENFFPIYYEDVDYYRRAALAGLERLTVMDTHIVHAGSKSLGLIAEPVHVDRYARNQAYFLRKWGGEKGHEIFERPFNDPALGLKIAAAERGAPYGDYDRVDSEIVR